MFADVLPETVELRPGQLGAIDDILAAFKDGAKTVFLDAPVGSGKSLINLLVATRMKGAYLSTPQVILVNQYGSDTADDGKFPGLAATLYGRRNYACEFMRTLPQGDGGRPYATAEGAPCTFLPGWPRECPAFNVCEYYSAKRHAQEHPQTVTTMAYLLTGIRTGLYQPESGWHSRPILVIDEAHNLAEEIGRLLKAEIGPNTLPGFRRKWLESPADPRFRVIDSLPTYIDRLGEVLSSLHTEGIPPKKTRERIERLSSARRLAEDIVLKLSNGTVEWVHSFDSRRIRHSWRPLSVRGMLSDFWNNFDHILLCSGTFFGIETLLGDCGLPAPSRRVVVADTFPPSRAPIRPLSAATLGYKADELEYERAADAIAAIASAHPEERGLIHANSYRLASAIRKYLPREVRRRLVSHDSINRTNRFARWRSEGFPNTIFLAVAMSQGIDLVGDIARWQVIVKVPFPNLGDTWVRRRREQTDGQLWYSNRTLIDVLQASGRIMRSAEDWGTTYFVDSHMDQLLENDWLRLPEWFRNRVVAGRKSDRALPGKFGDYSVRIPRK
ncbi:MAG: helicase C-terminal domain-containing protein [Thermoplasmata archaeon]